MNKEEIVELLNLQDETIFLEPTETFNKGIVGATHDGKHLIYDYDLLTNAIAETIKAEEAIEQAVEWLDYNTLRSLPYMNSEGRPIIMFPMYTYE